MEKLYKSDFYKEWIKVDNVDWEIIVSIKNNSWNDVIYSLYDTIEKKSYSDYINNCLLWSFIVNIPKNVLIIWFGWWAFGKYLEDYVSWINITWIEIDKAMIEIAKVEMKVKDINYFNLDVEESIDILNRKKWKFDAIYIDIYNDEVKIPNCFLDLEFIKKIANILWRNWIISMNYSDYDKYGNSKYYNDIHNNFTAQFWPNFLSITTWNNNYSNISNIYNLNKKYTSEEVNLAYLEKVQNCEINYDSNLIYNTFIWDIFKN